jgi:murein DD-endopeptidase MepM/ murein hydrolase activator NlpD
VQAVVLLVALCVLAPVPAAGAGSGTGPQTASESTANAAPGYPWTWPVEGAHTVTQPFRAPAHEYGPGHRGMDVAAAPDGVVRAPASGVVAFRGDVAGRPLITIDHGDGYVTTLEPVASALPPGAAVAAGDDVGTTGAGGHAVRGTLHVGVRVDGRYVNPRGLFGGLPRAILLPCCAG